MPDDFKLDYGTTNAARVQRLQEIRPGEHAPEGYSLTSFDVAVAHQRLFAATSERLTIVTALRVSITNPAGSGRRLILHRITSVLEEDVTVYGTILLNPTAGLPVSAVPTFNTTIGSAVAPVGVVRADNGTATTGGTVLGTLGVPKGRHNIDLPGLVVSPGVTLGFTFSTVALQTRNGSIELLWREQDLTDA